jgi:methionyl-tRNA synthetase
MQLFWPADVHMIGKDILRFHAAIWPAMLMSAGLPLPKTIFVHGFILSGGQKISKTVGNIVDPFAFVEQYGADALRYYLLREIPPSQDGDFTQEKFEARYQSDLANGLGNLVARVAALGQKTGPLPLNEADIQKFSQIPFPSYYHELVRGFQFNELVAKIWEEIQELDKRIEREKPWEADGEALQRHVREFGWSILYLAHALEPLLPHAAQRIKEQFSVNAAKHVLVVKKGKPLFPRL